MTHQTLLAGLVLLVVAVLIMITDSQPEPEAINLTASDCAAPARCYP